LAVGEKAPALEFKEVWHLPRSPADFGDTSAVVLVFTVTDCPATNAYGDEWKRLDAAYRERGVQFVSINASARDSIQPRPRVRVRLPVRQRPRTTVGVDAIEAVLAGRAVDAAETTAVGSPIPLHIDVEADQPVT
jgi:hypothetical protein